MSKAIDGVSQMRYDLDVKSKEMSKTTMIHAKISAELKEDVTKILKELGLSATEAITLFLFPNPNAKWNSLSCKGLLNRLKKP